MRICDLHTEDKEVSAKPFFKGEGMTVTMQIKEGGLLKEHITKIPAVLTCLQGEVVFENEDGIKETLCSGDYIEIEPMVKHWVKGIKESQLLLLK